MNSVRLGQLISHECDWQLRELAAYMGSLLALGRADDERNPLRAEVIGAALYRGIEAISGDRDHRRNLRPRARRSAWPQAMPECYAEIIADAAGARRPAGAPDGAHGRGPGQPAVGAANSGYASLPRDGRTSTRSGHGELDEPRARATSTCSPRIVVPWPRPSPAGTAGQHPRPAAGAARSGVRGGRGSTGADQQLMTLLRRLAASRRELGRGTARPAGGGHRRLAAAAAAVAAATAAERRRRRSAAASTPPAAAPGGCGGYGGGGGYPDRRLRPCRARGTGCGGGLPARRRQPAASARPRARREPRQRAITGGDGVGGGPSGGGRRAPVQRRPDRPDGRQPDPRPPRGADAGLDRQARPHGDRRRRQPVRPDPVRLAGAAADGARRSPACSCRCCASR